LIQGKEKGGASWFRTTLGGGIKDQACVPKGKPVHPLRGNREVRRTKSEKTESQKRTEEKHTLSSEGGGPMGGVRKDLTKDPTWPQQPGDYQRGGCKGGNPRLGGPPHSYGNCHQKNDQWG